MRRNTPYRVLAFLSALIIGGCSLVHAATSYYVSPTGNDSNPGTLAAPWATVNKGVDLYNAGDTVYFRAGVYAPTNGIYFYRSGSAAGSITARSYPGETVIFDGAQMSAGTTLVYIASNYFVFQDIELRNAKGNGISLENCSNVTISNITVHDSVNSGMCIGKGDLASTHHITVQNSTVYNNCHMNDPHTLNGGWPGALVVGGGNNVTFKNNTVYKNQGEGMIFYLADSCRATSNISHDNYGPNMYIDNATNCVIERNMLYSTNDPAYFRGGTPCAGIQFANEPYAIQNISHDISIINNILVSNNVGFYYGSYGLGGGLKNFTFANNSIYMSRAEMIHVDADTHSNAIFSNNISYQRTGGTQTVLPGTLTGISFSKNLWNGAPAGSAAAAGDINADPKFVNAGSTVATDYSVQAGSPVKSAGATLASVTNDFAGTARSQPMDVGAFVAPSALPVNHPPVLSAAPTCTPNPATTGQTVTFSASATDADNDPLTYSWDMGNGITKTGASVTQVYATAGSYTVVVTVTDGKGGSDTKSVAITVTTPVNHPPVLSAPPTCTPNPGAVGQTLTLTASATDPDSDPLTYSWDMGNGTTKTGASITQVYNAAGTYTVTVTVSDGRGGSDSKTVSVPVNVALNHAPVLSAIPTCTPNAGVVGQTLSFSANATDVDSDPLTYTWNMGNGTSLTGASVTQAYSTAGTYTASVVVSDGRGGSDTKSVSVTINVPPPNHPPVLSAAPSCSPNPATVGQTQTFTASATDADNDPLAYTWNLGNGTTKTGASITQVYASAGVYSVTVTATDGKGGSDTKSVSVTVNAPVNHQPVLSAAPLCSPNPAIAGQAMVFSASATDADNDPLTYTWDLGNGTIRTGAVVTQIYASAGVYTARVTVSDGKGGTDTKTVNATVILANTPPTLSSMPTFGPNPGFAGQAVIFTAAATNANKDALSYSWNMGDGTTLSGATINKTFSIPGSYNVVLTVSDGKGGITSQNLSASVVTPSTPMTVSNVLMIFDLKTASDTIVVLGTVPLPVGFNLSNANAIITISGFSHPVTLTSKGVSTDRTFKINAKTAKGLITTTNVPYVLNVKKAQIFHLVTDIITDTSKGTHSLPLTVTMVIGDSTFTGDANAIYTIK